MPGSSSLLNPIISSSFTLCRVPQGKSRVPICSSKTRLTAKFQSNCFSSGPFNILFCFCYCFHSIPLNPAQANQLLSLIPLIFPDINPVRLAVAISCFQRVMDYIYRFLEITTFSHSSTDGGHPSSSSLDPRLRSAVDWTVYIRW
jgi:hypothetical protein